MFKNTEFFKTLSVASLAALAVSCGGGGADEGESTGPSFDDQDGDSQSDAEDDTSSHFSPSDPMPKYEIYDDFTIPINQTITVGSFVMDILDVEVLGSVDGTEAPQMQFTVNPENLDDESQVPFYAAKENENLLLEIDGNYFDGLIFNSDKVPGYRVGKSGLLWNLDDPTITPKQIREGVITLGPPSRNQVVLPLSAPEEVVSLNEIPLEPLELEAIYGRHRLVLDQNVVQFVSKSNNEFLRKNTARLVLEGTVYGAGSQSCIGLSDTFITAPDGISRQALSSMGCVKEGTVKTVILSFEIEEPIAGTYEIGFVPSHDTTSETYTFEVVVP